MTTEEKERHAKLGSLRLARTYAATAREASRNERYRALLQQNLDHLDAQIAELEKAPRLIPT